MRRHQEMKRHGVLFREMILAFACALKEVMQLLKHLIMILLQACYLKDVQ